MEGMGKIMLFFAIVILSTVLMYNVVSTNNAQKQIEERNLLSNKKIFELYVLREETSLRNSDYGFALIGNYGDNLNFIG